MLFTKCILLKVVFLRHDEWNNLGGECLLNIIVMVVLKRKWSFFFCFFIKP